MSRSGFSLAAVVSSLVRSIRRRIGLEECQSRPIAALARSRVARESSQ